jgi:hypothetical protein
MGSAAGLMAVPAAQAADLPVKAAPVEYVKVCNLYGAGFWYVPGTDTCMKIGNWVRFELRYATDAAGGPLQTTGAGRLDRTDYSPMSVRVRALSTFDARTQTEYGTLRTYFDIGAQTTSLVAWPNTPLSGGNTTTAEAALNSQFNNNNVDNTRAFIQFAGFTAGRMRSFFDINSVGAYTLAGQRILADSSPNGIAAIGYTANLGGGFSWSFDIEDPGLIGGSRGVRVTDVAQFAYGSGAFAGGASLDNSGVAFFDPVMNLRLDQSWGYAAISGAFHRDTGGYYNNSLNTLNAGLANTTVMGHPGDTWGWATAVGFLLTDFLGNKGDTFAAQVNYGVGAIGYVTATPSTWAQRNGFNIAGGFSVDGVFADTTQIAQSSAYAWAVMYEHFWTPKLHTAFQGGMDRLSWGQDGRNIICSGAPGFVRVGNSLGSGIASTTGQPRGFVNGWSPNSVCNPSFGWYQVGTRTIWNPHPDIDIGVEVLYTGIQTANKGATVNVGAASGGLPPGLYTFRDEGILSGSFRLQRNFLP